MQVDIAIVLDKNAAQDFIANLKQSHLQRFFLKILKNKADKSTVISM